MNKFRIVLLFVSLTGFLAGCQSVPANRPAVTSAPLPPPSTALTITVENEGMTEAEYQARRDDLIAYLIERGYIQTEDDLVADSSSADRIIQATFGADGGFKFSVYSLDSEEAANRAVVATYAIPASYYGDYYYYGFAPVPFYGYSSWPAYYPIYPTYPVCAPVRPIVPYCSPAGPYSHNNHHVEPALYVNCGFQSKPSNQWAWNHSYPTWQNGNRYSHGNGRGNQRYGQPIAAAERTAQPSTATRLNPSASGTRMAERGIRPHYPTSRVDRTDNRPATAPVADASPSPATTRRHSSPPNRPIDGRIDRPYNPTTPPSAAAPVADASPATKRDRSSPPNRPIDGRIDRPYNPTTPSSAAAPASQFATVPRPTSPDNRPYTTTYPRAGTPDNRNTTARANPADNRPRTSNPERPNAPRTTNPERPTTPRPANVANNTRPAPAPSQHHDSAPRSSPAPRSEAPAQSHSSPSTPTSQTSSSVRDNSSIRSANER